MIAFLSKLFGLLRAVARLFADRQLIEAGRAAEAAAAKQEIERRVEQAEAVVAAIDPIRDERLRRRFDRSRNGQ